MKIWYPPKKFENLPKMDMKQTKGNITIFAKSVLKSNFFWTKSRITANYKNIWNLTENPQNHKWEKKIRESDFLTNQNYHKTEEMQNVLENSEMKKIFLYLKNCPKNHQKTQKWLFLAKNAVF